MDFDQICQSYKKYIQKNKPNSGILSSYSEVSPYIKIQKTKQRHNIYPSECRKQEVELHRGNFYSSANWTAYLDPTLLDTSCLTSFIYYFFLLQSQKNMLPYASQNCEMSQKITTYGRQ